MPDSNYPKALWRYCEEHDDFDSNGDGMCRKYGTAAPQFREEWGPCWLAGHGQGRRPDVE